MKEIKIKSAYQFFKIAHECKVNRNHCGEIEFYRGHSDKEWRLLPSIYRQYMLSFEEDLVNEFIRRCPGEFEDTHGLFNVLAKMQHYGLHTRLLDVTQNPAVALYFACFDKWDKDGEIFIFKEHLDDLPNNAVLNIITEFYIRNRDEGGNYSIKSYYDHMFQLHSKRDIDRAFYYITNGYYCFARPRIISERILRQAGSFMFFVDEVCPQPNCDNHKCIRKQRNECEKDNIPKKLEDKVEIIGVKRCLKDITDLHIVNEQYGNRYIIQAKDKEKIISELQTIGITKAFLFPELNSEGEDIMHDYYRRVGKT